MNLKLDFGYENGDFPLIMNDRCPVLDFIWWSKNFLSAHVPSSTEKEAHELNTEQIRPLFTIYLKRISSQSNWPLGRLLWMMYSFHVFVFVNPVDLQ